MQSPNQSMWNVCTCVYVCINVCISYQIYNLHMTKRSNDVQYILLLTINYDFIGRIGLEQSRHILLVCAVFIYHMIWSFSRFQVHIIWARENLIIANNIIAAKNIVFSKRVGYFGVCSYPNVLSNHEMYIFCSLTCNITLRRQDGDSFIGLEIILYGTLL